MFGEKRPLTRGRFFLAYFGRCPESYIVVIDSNGQPPSDF
jgi:hypothetical protein